MYNFKQTKMKLKTISTPLPQTTTQPINFSKASFSFEEVLASSLAYFNDDELAATTWMNKYAMKNKSGEFMEQDPDAMHRRMAKEFSRIEGKYAKNPILNNENLSDYGQRRKQLSEKNIYSLFKEFAHIIPQGSVMASLGNKHVLASLSNCVVMPEVHDSYGGIFQTDQQLAQLFKRRCGVGIDLSSLRPKGLNVANAAGTTSGAISFMERFSNTTREVAQNGRRGALMLTMDIAHPDIMEFITIKQDLTKVTGANISIRLSDEFMNAVDANTTYTHRWPIEAEKPLIEKTINAKELWDTIINCAHATAEPGLIFWDRQHNYSTSSIYPGFKNTSTNPCSEIAMQGGDSCRLIALNLFSYVKEPFTKKASFNYSLFYKDTYEAQRLMDDLVDLELEAIERILAKVNLDPEPSEIKKTEIDTWKLLYNTGKKGRRTGLGFTALADTIAALGFAFDADEALVEVESIMKVKCEAEFDSSIDMAIERGRFEVFDKQYEEKSEFVTMLKEEFPALHKRMLKYGRRNISISTVAPTGSLSMLAQTSSGIEPVFLLSYKRRRKVNPDDPSASIDFIDDLGDEWQEFPVYHHKFKQWMDITGLKDAKLSPYYKATASEIDWKKRIKMQAIVQKYVTHSISSTVNLPSETSLKRVSDIYMHSWKNGLKGVTVYRDGSRAGVLVSTNTEKKDLGSITENHAPSRPKKIEAKIIRFQNEYEKWMAVVGLLNGKPYEIFTGKTEDSFFIPKNVDSGWIIKNKNDDGSSRYDFQFADKENYKITFEGLSRSFNKEFWNYAKLISGVLRHGMPLHYAVELVSNLHLYDENINTWKNGIVRALKTFIPNGTKVTDKTCGECSSESLVYEEGCLKCVNCGFSKCG